MNLPLSREEKSDTRMLDYRPKETRELNSFETVENRFSVAGLLPIVLLLAALGMPGCGDNQGIGETTPVYGMYPEAAIGCAVALNGKLGDLTVYISVLAIALFGGTALTLIGPWRLRRRGSASFLKFSFDSILLGLPLCVAVDLVADTAHFFYRGSYFLAGTFFLEWAMLTLASVYSYRSSTSGRT